MAEPIGSLIDLVVSLIDALEASDFAYALGGALAYSAWAEPRATQDIDLNVWTSEHELDAVFDLLERHAVTIDREAARRDVRERGMFVARAQPYRVDVFVPSVPFYDEALKRRRRIHLAGREAWVLSPESLVVFKMLFFRPKDLADVGRILEIQMRSFDRAFVRRWLLRMLGEADERIDAWDELCRQHPPSC